MMISTRGRYALRVLLDLAEHAHDSYIPLKEISQRQEISLKYLESIMSLLSRNGLVDALPGKGGGYQLAKKPEDYKIGEILRLTEGSLAPVSCLECSQPACSRAEICKTRPLWTQLDQMISNYLDSLSLKDFL